MDLTASPTSNMKCAQNVCYACMNRKKACDKALPACGFCANRQLYCRYDVPALKRNGRKRHNPGRHFVALRSPSPPTVSASHESLPRTLPLPGGTTHASVDASLHQLAESLLDATNLEFDGATKRYFTAFHASFPIVSPDSFCEEAARYQKERRIPPADFTVLRLAIVLMTLSATKASFSTHITQESFYMSTKAAFAQAQASMATSLRLVQAALLLSLREYLSTRTSVAYTSMMTCVGMARLLGTTAKTIKTTRELEANFRADMLEKENVAWAIAMLERYD